MVGLGMALLGGLSSSARAADYVTTCQNGSCKSYATLGSKMPTICYCKPETYNFIQDPAAPSLPQLRTQGYNTYSRPWVDAQGQASTLYLSTNDPVFARALNNGFTLNSFTVTGRTAVLALQFP